MIQQGTYNLTASAMRLRGQEPLYAGDDYAFQFTLVQPDGVTPVVITGWSIKMTFRFSLIEGVPATFTKAATIPTGGGPLGRFDIAISRSDWAGPDLRFGKYDIQRVITVTPGPVPPATYESVTILSGDIEMLPNVTQAVP